MASQLRRNRINEAIQKTLWEIIQYETELEVLASILEVKTSVDLQWADVFVSVFPFERRQETIAYLVKRAPYFQALLNRKLNIKHTPKIRFKADVRLQLENYQDMENPVSRGLEMENPVSRGLETETEEFDNAKF